MMPCVRSTPTTSSDCRWKAVDDAGARQDRIVVVSSQGMRTTGGPSSGIYSTRHRVRAAAKTSSP